MEFVISFILQNFEFIASVVVLLLWFINFILLIHKRNVKVKFNDIFTQVLTHLPGFINEAESKFSKGAEKYSFVFTRCVELLRTLTSLSGQEILSEYTALIDSAIENILSTPTKKVR